MTPTTNSSVHVLVALACAASANRERLLDQARASGALALRVIEALLDDPRREGKAFRSIFVTLPDDLSDAAGVAAWLEEAGIQSKQDWIKTRDALKAIQGHLDACQTVLARRTRTPGGDSSAQWMRASLARDITKLIAFRRAGRAWARVQAMEAADAAREQAA